MAQRPQFGFSVTPGPADGVAAEAAAGSPDEVEKQIRSAIAAGAGKFNGAIDADLPEHRERITSWARLVLPRFRDA